ncbi:MAG: PIN domain-containing protein [archaeon]|jgi:predicted nucleic acid-binding protein
MASQKVLVDTNIFLDYYLNRQSGYLPIGEFASNFIKDTLSCKYIICLSEIVLRKLQKQATSFDLFDDNVLQLLRERNKLEEIKIHYELVKQAKVIMEKNKVPFNDALIALTAKKLNIPVITRDKHFFEELNYIAKVILPEEL